MVVDLKTAIVKPLLKKPSLDKHLLKNHRPISNLPFLSKILGKRSPQTYLPSPRKQPQRPPSVSVSSRTLHWDRFVMFVNNILSAVDNDNISVLFLLDLSSTFDTIDHNIFLSCLNSILGIQSTALQWFQSCLSHRYQSTSVDNSSSSPWQLKYGVPEGSVPAPVLFVLYTTPLSDIIADHSVNRQLFADDTQLQKSAPLSEARKQCVKEILLTRYVHFREHRSARRRIKSPKLKRRSGASGESCECGL